MELAVPTGIVEEFPSANTGKILGSNGFKDILALKHPIPGSEGHVPVEISKAYASVLIDRTIRQPLFFSKRFEDRNHELYLIVDIPEPKADYYRSKRWKARMIMRAKGILTGFRIDSVQGIPIFWLEELKDGQVA